MNGSNKQGRHLITRNETRRERYVNKSKNAKKFPISLATINFIHDENLGYLIRAAACFGAQRIYTIGHVPPRSVLMPTSGSLVDFVDVVQFQTPHDFLEHVRKTNAKLVSAELCDGAVSLFDYQFCPTLEYVIVLGNEETGIPGDILHHSEKVFVEMSGVGYCLNTAQTGNLFLFEYQRQMKRKG